MVDPTDPPAFWIMTDRMQIITAGVANRLLFPLPNFVPTIGKFRRSGLARRQPNRGMEGLVITPVSKSFVDDLLTHSGGYPHDTLEDVTLVGRDLLVVFNDDHFGVVQGGSGTIASKILPATQRRSTRNR